MDFRLIRLKDSLTLSTEEDLDERFRELLAKHSSHIYAEYLPSTVEEAFTILQDIGYCYERDLNWDSKSDIHKIYQSLYISNIMYSLLRLNLCPICKADIAESITEYNKYTLAYCISCNVHFRVYPNCFIYTTT